jgi:hypothetical protein
LTLAVKIGFHLRDELLLFGGAAVGGFLFYTSGELVAELSDVENGCLPLRIRVLGSNGTENRVKA